MSAAGEYRVWVGCLACYTNGNLIGEWFDGADAPQELGDFNAAVKTPKDHKIDGHEELWVFDHEGSPVRSEYSPMDAERYAEELELIESEELPLYLEWLGHVGEDFSADEIETFRERRMGTEDLAEYVSEIYDGAGEIPDWALPHMSKVYDSMATDMVMGGEVFEIQDEWFHSA